MLEQIVLNNFLLFNDYQHFNLKRINLLTGLNKTGKTDFLKSILLIRQSLFGLSKHNKLTLNSKIIQFGTFDKISNNRELFIKVKYDGLIHTFKSSSIKNSIEGQEWGKVKIGKIHDYQDLPKISDKELDKILGLLKDIRYDHRRWDSAMALILGSLRAKPNDIIMSQHPGGRFHPSVQKELIEALFRKKKNGVQWYIETHNEAVFNAFRILVKRQNIDSNDLNILHFTHKNGASPIPVKVEPDGSIENWPEYFFDQNDKDYEELFEF